MPGEADDRRPLQGRVHGEASIVRRPGRRAAVPVALVLALLLAAPSLAQEALPRDSETRDSEARDSTARGSTARGSTVRGTIRFVGAAPDRKITVTRDAENCGRSIDDDVIALGGESAGENTEAPRPLRNVVVWVEGAKGEAPTTVAEIRQQACQFVPRVTAVSRGSEVTFVNADRTHHSVRLLEGRKPLWTVAMPIPNQRLTRRLEKAGAYAVRCEAHDWARGAIHVFDHPYFAVSGGDGTFEIRGVPEGKFELVAWHESLGEQRSPLTVEGEQVREIVFKR